MTAQPIVVLVEGGPTLDVPQGSDTYSCPTDLSVTGNIAVSGTVDGRDVATDGSKLDGIETSATADQTANEILTAIKTVDGASSGLDADLLDGNEASAFAAAAHSHAGMLLANGTVPLTADWDAGGYEIRAQTFESDVARGTAPLVVASDTPVDNLRAAAHETLHGIEAIGAVTFVDATHILSVASVTYWWKGIKFTSGAEYLCQTPTRKQCSGIGRRDR